MTAQQLRKSILQMAVQGKLVPQDPSDEPAHILLERIRAEKERLIKEKKIKKEKNPSVIYRGMDNLHYEKFADGTIKYIEDEIPFEIPESWAWCRLGNISDNIQYGLSNSAEKVGTCRFLRITDIQNGGVDWDTVPFTNTNELDKYLLHINDILFARTGGTVGKSFLVSHLPFDSVFASYLIRVQLTNDISAQYIYWFFNSPTYWEQITCKTVGTGQPNCNGASLRNLLIPLPPLDEQYRILNKLAEIRPLIEDYSATYNRIQDVHKGFPDKIKQSVLQWAVQGKLVQQDENDEPASVLLERIRAEKEELIKQGKLKKDKHESIIFRRDNSYYERLDDVERCIDDEIPFEIPHNWSWSRLGAVFTLQAGKNIPSSEISEEPHSDLYPCYGGNGIRGFVSKTNRSGKHPIIGRQGALCGNINMATGKFYATEHAICVDTYCNTHVPWGCLFLEALNFNQYATATAQPGLSVSKINEVLIPIPPLAEQRRIYHTFENCSSIMQSW